MAETTVDEARSEAFAERMVGVLNDAALALMTSIGHQVALFDTMAELGPATSAQIADAGGLDERYVREWLGAMTTGHIVEYDPAKHIFALPAEHAAWLTRAAGPENLAIQAQYIPLLAEVEQPLVECFRRGGGVPYSAYPRFQRLMSEDSSAVHDAALLDTIVPLVDGLGARLEEGSDVADIGCGRGHAVNLMAQAHPASRFTGFDLSQEAIAEAQVEAERMGLANARFEVRDVSELGESDAYDFITAFDAVHDQARPAEVLAGIAEALRPGGVVLMVDIAGSSDVGKNLDLPLAPFMYTVSCMHCMTVSLAMDGAGLGAMWGEETARRMLAEAGFASVEVHRIEGDILNNYYVATTPTA